MLYFLLSVSFSLWTIPFFRTLPSIKRSFYWIESIFLICLVYGNSMFLLTIELVVLFHLLKAAWILDISTLVVPDRLQICVFIALCCVFLNSATLTLRMEHILSSFLLLVSCMAFFPFVSHKIGGADLKFCCIVCFFFGLLCTFLILWGASLFGLIWAAYTKKNQAEEFAFFPCLIVSFVLFFAVHYSPTAHF